MNYDEFVKLDPVEKVRVNLEGLSQVLSAMELQPLTKSELTEQFGDVVEGTDTMLGVVLWNDVSNHKAVIWCEDLGDLAFFSDVESDLTFSAGDLVRFSFVQQDGMRLAKNLTVLTLDPAPTLAHKSDGLGDVKSTGRDQTTKPRPNRIPFEKLHETAEFLSLFAKTG